MNLIGEIIEICSFAPVYATPIPDTSPFGFKQVDGTWEKVLGLRAKSPEYMEGIHTAREFREIFKEYGKSIRNAIISE